MALLTSDHAWLWSRGFEGGGPQLDLLRRLAHWMMKEPELEEEALPSVDLTSGWRLMLTEPGEKVLATPLTITGKVFFTTYLPQAGTGATACSPSEGAGRLYAVALQDAKAVINYDTSDDGADNPDGDPTTKNDRHVELQSLGIPAEVVSVPPNKILRPDLQIDNLDATTRWRTFWYLAEDEDL